MKRRTFLGTAVAVVGAGCVETETEDKWDDVDLDSAQITGLSESSAYHDYDIYEAHILDQLLLAGDINLHLKYDDDAAYIPADHSVYLLDGHDVIAEADSVRGDPEIYFALDIADVADDPKYRVVSKDAVSVVDDFELSLEMEGEHS